MRSPRSHDLFGQEIAELLHRFPVLGVVCYVHILVGVVLVIEEHAFSLAIFCVDVVLGRYGGALSIAGKRRILPRPRRIMHEWNHAGALKVIRQLDAGQLTQRRVEIDQLDDAVRFDVLFKARRMDNQRQSRGVMEKIVFGPEVVLSQMPTMIAPEDYDGIIAKSQFIQIRQEPAHKGIRVVNTGIVSMPGDFVKIR